MRLAPIGLAVGITLDFSASDPLQTNSSSADIFSPITIGTIIQVAPTEGVILTANVPNWGVCELVYVRYATAGALPSGTIVNMDKNFTIGVNPVTANTGRPVMIAVTSFTAGDVTPQGGWALRSGICPVIYPTAAVGVLGISGATPGAAAANSAGRQLLNATCLIASASNFTRLVTTRNGSPFLQVASAAGVFIGQAVSGTGIPGGTTVSSISPDGQTIRMSANATATGTVTGTFTHTGYGICQLDRAFVQGAIT